MKRKMMGIILAAVLAISFVLGISGVVTLAGKEMTLPKKDIVSEDRLIGAFLTGEHLDLFDFDSYFEENANKILSGGEIRAEDSEEYGGRMYATLVDREGTSTKRQEYVFEGIEGIRFFMPTIIDEEGDYTASCIDEEVSGTMMNSFCGDNGRNRLELEGTVYMALTDKTAVDGFYFNPVYQTPEGEVYLTAGQGLFYNGDISEGAAFSHEIKEERKTAALKNDEETEQETAGSRVKISFEYKYVPESIRIVQMSGENTVLFTEEYKPGTVPETLIPKAGTAYVLVETQKKDTEGQTVVKRDFFQKEDAGFTTEECPDGKYIVRHYTEIKWF